MRMLFGLAFVTYMTSSAAQASTWIVTKAVDDGSNGTLRYAINNAAAGDTITFNLPNSSTILLTNSTQIIINRNLTIIGPGASQLIIDASKTSGADVFDIGGGAQVAISGVTLQGGYDGIYVYSSGTVASLSAVTVRNCSGEGIYNDIGTTLSLANSTVSGNTQDGGVYLSFNTNGVISQSTISANGNRVDSNGVQTFGTLTISQSTVSGNPNGGLYVSQGDLTVINSTVSGNGFAGGNSGGGLYSDAGSTTHVIASTIAGNVGLPGAGGGVSAYQSTITLKNTLISNNTGGNCFYDVGAVFISAGHNLDNDGSCVLSDPTDLHNAIAGFAGGLADNGGPMQTIALLASSPAVDAIPVTPTNYCTDLNGNPITTDQRGVTRPNGAGCDIGAYELKVADAILPTANPTPNTGWNTTDVTVIWNWTDAGGPGIDPANCPASTVSSGQGVAVLVTATCKDLAGNTGSAFYTVKVDETNPTITISATKADTTVYTSGMWTNQTVTVHYTCSDSISGIAICPADQVFSVDGTTSVSGTAVDNAGNSASSSLLLVRIDKTNPTITVSATKADTTVYTAGTWTNQTVTVHYTCSDSVSGVASCPANQVFSADGGTASASGTATNNAGNSASASFGPIQIDKKGPTISIASPVANAAYPNTNILNIAWTAGDALSGVASQSGTLDGNPITNGQPVNLFFLSLASHTVVVRATDGAGNTNSVSAAFSVIVTASSMIDSVTEELVLGGIDSAGIANSLLSKLGANPTGNSVNAFLNELNAQNGKHITAQAYAVLRAAALHLLSTLP
jgi:hypothetical protein